MVCSTVYSDSVSVHAREDTFLHGEGERNTHFGHIFALRVSSGHQEDTFFFFFFVVVFCTARVMHNVKLFKEKK